MLKVNLIDLPIKCGNTSRLQPLDKISFNFIIR